MGILRWGIVAEMESDDGTPPRQFGEVDHSPHGPHDGRSTRTAERDLRIDVALCPFCQRDHRRFFAPFADIAADGSLSTSYIPGAGLLLFQMSRAIRQGSAGLLS